MTRFGQVGSRSRQIQARRASRSPMTTPNPEGRSARALADRAIQRAAGRVDPVASKTISRASTGARYIDFLVPGLIGLGIMNNGVWSLGFSIVDSRRRKLTKRLFATPMSRTQYLLAYAIWRVILSASRVRDSDRIRHVGVWRAGAWLLIVITGLCLLGSLCFSAMGILVGSRAGPSRRCPAS